MSKEKNPLVSVIMTVYNSERFLKEAIDSILRQSFENFEFIIINDGSPDNSQSIIDEYAANDDRIVAIKQNNVGLVKSLNKGIFMSRGLYIARMDSDDVCMDNRLLEQVNFLDKNKDVVLLGGGFEIIDEDGYYITTIHPPTSDFDLRRTMLLRNPFGHASVMFRKESAINAGLYSDQCGPTEDYEFWIRLKDFGKIAALPRPLYRYRINRQGISAQKAKIQDDYRLKHVSLIWSQKPFPSVVKRTTLRKQSRNYLKSTKNDNYNIGMFHQYLEDNAQIAIKMIKNHHSLEGIAQLLALATSSKSGLRAVKGRLKILFFNLPKSAEKILRGHRNTLENVDLPKPPVV